MPLIKVALEYSYYTDRVPALPPETGKPEQPIYLPGSPEQPIGPESGTPEHPIGPESGKPGHKPPKDKEKPVDPGFGVEAPATPEQPAQPGIQPLS